MPTAPYSPDKMTESAPSNEKQEERPPQAEVAVPSSVSTPSRSGCQNVTAAVSNLDHTIRRLSKLLSTTYGQERVLASLDYGTRVVHYGLATPPALALLTRLRALLRLQSTHKTPTPQATPPLLALQAIISETRTSLRLFGLVSMWTWGSATLRAPPSDPILRTVAFAQVLLCTIYQFMENVAYLTAKGVLPRRSVERWGSLGKWALWSTRAWLGHVMLEFVRLARSRQLAARSASASATDVEKGATTPEEIAAQAAAVRAWRKSLVSAMSWAPLCLHWSVEEGIGISRALTGVLGFSAGAWALLDAWKATA